jgi:quercetin dioxygenase-like cupin family protein
MITVIHNASQSSLKGPSEWFAGVVRIDALFKAPEPSTLSGGTVTFEPGARTAWHQHPLGQTLIVTAGRGFVQQWGKTLQVIQPGDIVSIPANAKHWHGAAADVAMTHIAMQESLNGDVVEWLEHVGEEQYPLRSQQPEQAE